MLKILEGYRHSEITCTPNYTRIPCTVVPIDENGARLFNDILCWVYKLPDMTKINRTPSGGISIKDLRLPCYDVRPMKTMVEITLLIKQGMWRIQFRNKLDDEKQGISGKQAFNKFKSMCKKMCNIDLNDYILHSDPDKYKSEITYVRKLANPVYQDLVFENAHHIDFNSSFMANLCEKYPEFTPVGEKLFNERKTKPINKGIMTNAIGYMHSKYHNCSWAQLAHAAIVGNNNKLFQLAKELEDNGRTPLLYNTDGIWYIGDVYHNDDEGSKLGQWKNDHTNCTIQIKSPNCYQFIENDVVNTVMSGYTKLDRIKPRDEWEWGEIYHMDASIIYYSWGKDGFIHIIEE